MSINSINCSLADIFMNMCRGNSFAVSVRWEREQRERTQQTPDSSGPVRTKQPMFTCTIEDFHKYFCCCSRRVGTMFFLLEKQDGSPIVVAGPCWPFCTFVTVPLIIVLSGLVAYFIVFNPEMGLVRLIKLLNIRIVSWLANSFYLMKFNVFILRRSHCGLGFCTFA